MRRSSRLGVSVIAAKSPSRRPAWQAPSRRARPAPRRGSQVRRFEQGLFLLRTIRAEDRKRIDQPLAGGAVDAIPVRVEVARGEIILERGEKTRAIDLLLAAAGNEVVGEGRAVDLADPERRVAGDIAADG